MRIDAFDFACQRRTSPGHRLHEIGSFFFAPGMFWRDAFQDADAGWILKRRRSRAVADVIRDRGQSLQPTCRVPLRINRRQRLRFSDDEIGVSSSAGASIIACVLVHGTDSLGKIAETQSVKKSRESLSVWAKELKESYQWIKLFIGRSPRAQRIAGRRMRADAAREFLATADKQTGFGFVWRHLVTDSSIEHSGRIPKNDSSGVNWGESPGVIWGGLIASLAIRARRHRQDAN